LKKEMKNVKCRVCGREIYVTKRTKKYVCPLPAPCSEKERDDFGGLAIPLIYTGKKSGCKNVYLFVCTICGRTYEAHKRKNASVYATGLINSCGCLPSINRDSSYSERPQNLLKLNKKKSLVDNEFTRNGDRYSHLRVCANCGRFEKAGCWLISRDAPTELPNVFEHTCELFEYFVHDNMVEETVELYRLKVDKILNG
jgi:hypothetical protein